MLIVDLHEILNPPARTASDHFSTEFPILLPKWSNETHRE